MSTAFRRNYIKLGSLTLAYKSKSLKALKTGLFLLKKCQVFSIIY